MATFFKAVRPDGTSFHDPGFRWATEPGGVTAHPNPGSDVGGYLSASVVPTDCTGMDWPCRLLEVEPVGGVWTPDRSHLPNERAAHAWRAVREVPAHLALGPQGEHVAALIERAARLTRDESSELGAAWGLAWGLAWGAAWDAAEDAARIAAVIAAGNAAGNAAWDAAGYSAGHSAGHSAGDAAGALLVRDLIATEQYDALTLPWRQVVGPIHPDDRADVLL